MLELGCVNGEVMAVDSMGLAMRWTTSGFVQDERSSELQELVDRKDHKIARHSIDLPISVTLGVDNLVVTEDSSGHNLEVLLNGKKQLTVSKDGIVDRFK